MSAIADACRIAIDEADDEAHAQAGMPPASSIPARDLEEVVTHYAVCALWSSHDDSRADPETGNGPNLDENYALIDLADETVRAMVEDCLSFMASNADDLATYCEGLGYGPEQIGHDLWLTRNGHGAGFWDRYYGADEALRAACMRLSDASKPYGTVDLYVEDGKVFAQ